MNKYKEFASKTLALNNFYTTCFLLCKGFDLVDIDKTNPRKASFVFENKENIESTLKDFDFAEKQSPEVMVDARKFIATIKSLKDKLYQRGA